MSDSESAGPLGETSPQSAAHSTRMPSSQWWWHRHLHVPVVVWIVASVLGGAAIGGALEPDGKPDKAPPTTEADSEPAAAVACDNNYANCVPVSSDVDCAGSDDPDVDGPSYVTAPVEVVGYDVYDLDADHNGIGCD